MNLRASVPGSRLLPHPEPLLLPIDERSGPLAALHAVLLLLAVVLLACAALVLGVVLAVCR